MQFQVGIYTPASSAGHRIPPFLPISVEGGSTSNIIKQPLAAIFSQITTFSGQDLITSFILREGLI